MHKKTVQGKCDFSHTPYTIKINNLVWYNCAFRAENINFIEIAVWSIK